MRPAHRCARRFSGTTREQAPSAMRSVSESVGSGSSQSPETTRSPGLRLPRSCGSAITSPRSSPPPSRCCCRRISFGTGSPVHMRRTAPGARERSSSTSAPEPGRRRYSGNSAFLRSGFRRPARVPRSQGMSLQKPRPQPVSWRGRRSWPVVAIRPRMRWERVWSRLVPERFRWERPVSCS